MSSTQIHPTALVDPTAELGPGVEVGPYCIIGPGVHLGAGTVLRSHVVVDGPTRIGENNLFYPFAAIGHRSQDLKYQHEPTYLEIGDGNTFREFATVHRATAPEHFTRIGHRGNFLAYSHIAHDCTVGNDVIFSNNGSLAGHVIVEDFVIVGAFSAVHQFCRVGRNAMVGACSKIVQDIPPFMIGDGNPAAIRGINRVGLERCGFEKDIIQELKEAYRILYRSELNTAQGLQRIKESLRDLTEIRHITDFIEASERGIVR